MCGDTASPKLGVGRSRDHCNGLMRPSPLSRPAQPPAAALPLGWLARRGRDGDMQVHVADIRRSDFVRSVPYMFVRLRVNWVVYGIVVGVLFTVWLSILVVNEETNSRWAGWGVGRHCTLASSCWSDVPPDQVQALTVEIEWTA